MRLAILTLLVCWSYVSVSQVPSDTLRGQTNRRFSTQELRRFLQTISDSSFSRMAGPQFEAQRAEIARLTQDVHTLTINNNILVKNNQRSIDLILTSKEKRDSLEQSNNYYRAQNIQLEREQIASHKETTVQFKQFNAHYLEQEATTKTLLNYIKYTWIIIALFGIFVFLFYKWVSYKLKKYPIYE